MQASATTLISHPDIHHLGILIQPVLKLFICQQCQIALTGNNIGHHLHTFHNTTQDIQVNTINIQNIVDEYNLLQEMPIITGPVPQIHGLKLLNNYVKCPQCNNICSRESLRIHYNRQHSDIKNCKINSLPGIFAQQLNHGANKKLFQVIPYPISNISCPTSSPKDIIKNLRSERDNLIQQYYPKDIDARAVSPWLLATGWHIHIQPYDAIELYKLVAMPKNEGRLGKLSYAVQSLLTHAYDLMVVTNTLILQKLNTADPIKDG